MTSLDNVVVGDTVVSNKGVKFMVKKVTSKRYLSKTEQVVSCCCVRDVHTYSWSTFSIIVKNLVFEPDELISRNRHLFKKNKNGMYVYSHSFDWKFNDWNSVYEESMTISLSKYEGDYLTGLVIDQVGPSEIIQDHALPSAPCIDPPDYKDENEGMLSKTDEGQS